MPALPSVEPGETSSAFGDVGADGPVAERRSAVKADGAVACLLTGSSAAW